MDILAYICISLAGLLAGVSALAEELAPEGAEDRTSCLLLVYPAIKPLE
jgi:hypothetical protein